MSIPKSLVVASGNQHKIAEIKSIFSDVALIPMGQAGFTDDIAEDGSSFAENALIKARAVCERLGLPAIADDSGICVDALGGAPGIYSARFSGGSDADNRSLLLKKLENVPEEKRTARFVCAICLYMPDGSYVTGEGYTHGKILTREEGEHGFGYDPLFFSDDLQKSFGTATEKEKNSVSHRYRALCDLRSKL